MTMLSGGGEELLNDESQTTAPPLRLPGVGRPRHRLASPAMIVFLFQRRQASSRSPQYYRRYGSDSTHAIFQALGDHGTFFRFPFSCRCFSWNFGRFLLFTLFAYNPRLSSHVHHDHPHLGNTTTNTISTVPPPPPSAKTSANRTR